ncbi:phospholipase A [Shigella flexneri]
MRDVEMGITTTLDGVQTDLPQLEPPLYSPDGRKGNWLVEVKPWYVVGNTDDNPDITKYMGYYQLKIGYHLGDAVLGAKGHQLEHRLRRRGVRL